MNKFALIFTCLQILQHTHTHTLWRLPPNHHRSMCATASFSLTVCAERIKLNRKRTFITLGCRWSCFFRPGSSLIKFIAAHVEQYKYIFIADGDIGKVQVHRNVCSDEWWLTYASNQSILWFSPLYLSLKSTSSEHLPTSPLFCIHFSFFPINSLFPCN